MINPAYARAEELRKEAWRWYPFQTRYMADTSRLVAVVKARQLGFTECSSALALTSAYATARSSVYVIGANFEGSKEIIYKATKWAEFLERLTGSKVIRAASVEKITLVNGSRIIALPCKPASIRGKSGTIILDEAAHYERDEEIWTAIAPAISSNPKLRIIMISTPFGERGVFWRACTGRLDSDNLKWSVHTVDVHKAIAEGYPKSVLDLRASYTEEQWAQEFLCSFLNAIGQYFDNELILASHIDDEGEPGVLESVTLGVDLAHSKDSSVAVELYKYRTKTGSAVYRAKNVTLLSSRESKRAYPEQEEILRKMIDSGRYARVVVDAAGVGAGLAQTLASVYGDASFGGLIRLHVASAKSKGTFIPALKVDLQAGAFKLERVSELVRGFVAVREVLSASNNLLYSMARDRHGHADAFSAVLMAYQEAKEFLVEGNAPDFPSVTNRPSRASRLRNL